MSFNYNQQNQQSFYNPAAPQSTQFQQQNIQPLFPQPQGNVYNINSTLEVANVPVGAGISVALCLQEGFMYIKTMQNGNPMFWAYKIMPYDTTKPQSEPVEVKKSENPFAEQFEKYDNRFDKIEQQVGELQNSLKKNKGEWNV
jgi:hypothetical protein